MIDENYRIFALSETTLTLQLENQITEDQIRFLHSLKDQIRNWPGILDILVTFHELSLIFDPKVETQETLKHKIRKILKHKAKYESAENTENQHTYIIPVCYDEEMAWDNRRLEERSGLSFAEIVDLHTRSEYLIYMIGFLPGFMYLGGLHEKLFCPRLDVPRAQVATGSIGIAGQQTGVYPMESPGGWNIIGRTPLEIMNFSPHPSSKNEEVADVNPVFFRPLDRIRFTPITRDKFEELRGMSVQKYQELAE